MKNGAGPISSEKCCRARPVWQWRVALILGRGGGERKRMHGRGEGPHYGGLWFVSIIHGSPTFSDQPSWSHKLATVKDGCQRRRRKHRSKESKPRKMVEGGAGGMGHQQGVG